MVYRKTGVLLLAFGGPETLDDVAPFMERLMGRTPPPELIERVQERYRLIGGGSPLPAITRRQADAIENELGSDDFRVFVGMHYSHPLIADSVLQMASAGIERAVALSLSPHSSRVSSAAYLEEVCRATAKAADAPAFLFIESWHTERRYLDAVAEKVRVGLAGFGDAGDDVEVIFSAHSLPARYIDDGDPYVDQIGETVAGVLERLGGVSWRLAYQSRGHGTGDWLGPDVATVMEEMAAAGAARVLVVPIGFVSDHVETLYDIDVVMRDKAESCGLGFRRAESLNTTPAFIEALTRAVRERLRVE